MSKDALSTTMSLLDALDRSYNMEVSSTSQSSPQNAENVHHFEVGSSTTKNQTLEGLKAARARQAGLYQSVDEVADILPSGSPRKSSGGFRLNYDQDTLLRAIDVGGADQTQKLSEFVSKAIDNLSHGITVKDAMKKLGLKNNKDLLPGLEVRLLGHQAIGVAWMLEKEKSSDKGGILADDMGLGKTVQMIATMAMHMPELNDDCRTTLIVVPAALLQQWKEEVETKSNGIFNVHIHHGRDKLKKTSQIRNRDVIITSYQTLCLDFSIPKEVAPDEEADWLVDNGGVLARTKFYRVIADEAQFIRNRSTRSSVSMAHVRAKYRWMLTGTPVTNTLADIYGLLRFGRFRPWNDWNDFNEHVARVQFDDAPLAGSRAQAILRPILLRRTKDSTLEGKPILELPPKEIELVKLKFSEEERDVYDSFEKRTKIRLNKFIRERTLVKNHAQVLVMILRLRQLCCHPHLILSQTKEYEDPTLLVGSDGDKELGRARKVMGASWVADVKKTFLLRAAAIELLDFSDEDDTPAANCPLCKEIYMNDIGRVLACGHEMCFDCMLEIKNAPIAHDGIFGYGNEKENLAVEKEFENAEAKGFRPCPTCRKMMDLSSIKTFKSSAFEPSDEELSNYARAKRQAKKKARVSLEGRARMRSPSPPKAFEDMIVSDSDSDDLPDVLDIFQTPKKQKKKMRKSNDSMDDDDVIDLTMEDVTSTRLGKRKAVDIEMQDESISRGKRTQDSSPITSPGSGKGKGRTSGNGPNGGPSDAVLATWSRGDDDMEPSSKMLALLGYLKKWENIGDKVICYSQWTSMLDLIEILLSRHGLRNLRFDGKMDRTSRDATLVSFKQAGGPSIMLISTKCGSVGLNLVSANRVINMDLSWNYAAESQAYDRCHRIGQDKTVYVKRLVVENTIEERMLRLQDVKVGLAEAALGEGTGAKLHKLSVKDIKYLFGMSVTKKDDSVHGRTQEDPDQ